MTTLMRNGRDRRSENPFWADAILERVQLSGTDQRITSGPAATVAASHGGKPPSENRPDTWLHPNASQKRSDFLLHCGRRPYMAQSGGPRHRSTMSAVESKPNGRRATPEPGRFKGARLTTYNVRLEPGQEESYKAKVTCSLVVHALCDRPWRSSFRRRCARCDPGRLSRGLF